MVNPITATGSSWVPNRAPASPFTSTGRARFTNRGAVLRTCPATTPDPASGGRARAARAEIRTEDHAGVEDLYQRLEVPGPRRRQEGVDHPALPRDVAVRLRGGLHP